jgi:hypothetical protein
MKAKQPSISADTKQELIKTTAILNAKQKAFVEKITTENMKPVDAYVAVYKTTSRQVAHSCAHKLLKHPAVITELQSLSTQLASLAHTDKHYLVQKAKALLERCEAEDNKKYLMEALDYLAKMAGYYNHTTTSVSIKVDKSISFGGFDPSNAEFVDITPGKDDE